MIRLSIGFVLFYFICIAYSCKSENKPLFTHSVIDKNGDILYEECIVDQTISPGDTLCSIRFGINGGNNYFFVNRKLQLGIEVRIQPQGDGYVFNIGYRDLYEKDIKHPFAAFQMENFLRISNFELRQGGRSIDHACALVPDREKLIVVTDDLSSETRMKFIVEMLKDRYHFSNLLFSSVLTDSKNIYTSTCQF
jgi:hypothetical protein